jgi:Dual specificity phosphatase, catalytic domain
MAHKHSRIVQHPFATSLQGALLDSYSEEQRGEYLHITLNIRALEHSASSELFERDRLICERVQGNYVPAKLHFSRISELKSSHFHKSIARLPQNDLTRTIEDMLSWRQPEREDIFFLFGMHTPNIDTLMFFAHGSLYERFPKESTPVSLERDWSPAPPMPERLVPQPKRLHERFGGDPITINVNGKVRHHKLFIGGLDIQPKHRPQVDAVLNLSEEDSCWVKGQTLHTNDRAINKGEGSDGMTVREIREEAEWVLERLKQNQRVLVHCAAGMNRSTTICCAALILLEGLSAEAALERVREHHPWARPDSHHWLTLRWLEITNKGKTHGL